MPTPPPNSILKWWNGSEWVPVVVGARGYSGSAGAGFTGSASTAAGYSGSLGYTGSQGSGFTGSVGYVGSVGNLGYTGSQGSGFTGSVGYVGSVGNLGYTGSQGTGFTGSASTVIGYTGSNGFTGSQGSGFTGSASTTIGFTGSQGTGFTGSQGSGFTGSVGFTGSGGLGYTGSQGSGFTGSASTTVGYSGSIGYSGSLGFTGSASTVIGYTGSQGVGYTGSTGFTGSASTVIGYTGSQGVGFTGSASTVIGYTGSQGTGFTGSFGFTGSASTVIGFTGSASTVIGYSGSTGFTGSASTVIGYTGSASTVIGYSGSTGFTGSIGYSGSFGFTGSRGIAGFNGSGGGVFPIWGERTGGVVGGEYFGLGNGSNNGDAGVVVYQDAILDAITVNAATAFTANATFQIYVNSVATGVNLTVSGTEGILTGINYTILAGDRIAFKCESGTGGTVVGVAVWLLTNGAKGYTGSASTVIGYTGSASTVIGYTGSASTVIGYSGSQGPTEYGTMFANYTLNGGGTVTFNGSSIVWSSRVIAIPVEKTEFGAAGYFDIDCPTSGTVTYYSSTSGTTTKTCDANGIPLGAWEAIYYQITPGDAQTSNQANFRVVFFTNADWDPGPGWMLICTRNGDDGSVKWMPGNITLPNSGGSFVSTSSTASWRTGYTGSASTTLGPTGFTGSASTAVGPTGFTGSGSTALGPTGFTGSASTAVGPTGFTGSASTAVGPTGFTGSASTAVGPTGFTGSASTAVGPTGFTGSASTAVGPTGFTGSRGTTGFTGSASTAVGPTGFTGSLGPTGFTGSGTSSSPQFTALGVGTAASATTGEIRATNNITAFFASDKRLKNNIEPISNALDKLSRLTGVMFDWTDDYIQKSGGEDGYFIRKHDTGLIAQEVEAVLPEVVATRPDGYKAIKYDRVIGLVVEAIKEQQAYINILENKINSILSELEKK